VNERAVGMVTKREEASHMLNMCISYLDSDCSYHACMAVNAVLTAHVVTLSVGEAAVDVVVGTENISCKEVLPGTLTWSHLIPASSCPLH
jgi:hypothetical protein